MFSGQPWRLRTYLYLLAPGILLPAVLPVCWTAYSQYRQAEEAAKQETYNLAQITADSTRLFLSNAEKLMKGLAGRIQSLPHPEQGCDSIFDEFRDLFPQLVQKIE